MNVSAAIITILKSEGVKYVFAVPGQTIDPLMEILSQDSEIKTIISAHEAGAAFMADGYSRAGNHFGVYITIGGPGFTNTLTALTTAYTDRSPVLAISGEISTKWEGRGGLQDSSSAGVQIKPVVTKALSLNSPLQLYHHMQQLLTKMLNPATRGPAHLAIATDILRAETHGVWHGIPDSVSKPRIIDQSQLARLQERLFNNHRIVILAGAGCVESGAGKALQQFAERLTIPVATTLHAKGLFPEKHPLSLGVFGWFGNEPAINAITVAKPSVLLVLGSRSGMLDSMLWHPAFSEIESLIIIDINPHALPAEWPVDMFITGDIKASLEYLNTFPLLPAKTFAAQMPLRQSWLQNVKSVEMYRPGTPCHSGLHPGEVTQILSQMLPSQSMIFTDSGAHAFFTGHYWPVEPPGRYFSAIRFMGPMGWAIPAAIGAKLACPLAPCIVVTGDGCMLMHGIEIQTAARYDIPLVCIVMNNCAHGNPKLRAGHFSAELAQMYTLPQHDWAMFARALGAQGFTATNKTELEDAVQAACISGKTTVIDVHTDNSTTPTDTFDQMLQKSSSQPY